MNVEIVMKIYPFRIMSQNISIPDLFDILCPIVNYSTKSFWCESNVGKKHKFNYQKSLGLRVEKPDLYVFVFIFSFFVTWTQMDFSLTVRQS